MNILLKKLTGSPWIWDADNEEYILSINDEVVAIIDSNGNLKIKGRLLKI